MNHRHILKRVGIAVLGATALVAVTTVSATPAWAEPTSAAAPEQVKSDLDDYAGTPAVTGLTWGVDAGSDTVVVTVPRDDTDADTTKFLDRAESMSDDIRIERVDSAPEPVLGPGDAIHVAGSRCSASVIGTNGSQDYVVTAGHCTNIGSQWSTGNGEAIGTTDQSVFPGNDYGTIRITNTSLQVSNGQLTEVGEPPVGAQIQKTGSTTGVTSGEILAYGVTVNYPEGALHNMI
ncbi:MAG: S1 family peptidase, partial [Stackebrandtia sp.]